MSELISGKEAALLHLNGVAVQFMLQNGHFIDITDDSTVGIFNEEDGGYGFRVKPKTITLNSIEVPAPFEPKDDEVFYHIFPTLEKGYGWCYGQDESMKQFGAWRTEEEIKQVIAALRSIFKGE